MYDKIHYKKKKKPKACVCPLKVKKKKINKKKKIKNKKKSFSDILYGMKCGVLVNPQTVQSAICTN